VDEGVVQAFGLLFDNHPAYCALLYSHSSDSLFSYVPLMKDFLILARLTRFPPPLSRPPPPPCSPLTGTVDMA